MVARINHGSQIAGVLLYNKRKIDAGTARVLLCHNLPLRPEEGTLDMRRLCAAFEPWLSHPCTRVQEPVFHVSLNPHPGDRLDKEQLIEVARFYMERMGYGDQPYVVFQHQDIARTHLHVVASRIRPGGHAVAYQDYRRRSKAATEEIERVFGLIPAASCRPVNPLEELRKVRYRDSDLKVQLASVLHGVTEHYRFASRGEYATLLALFNVWMEECRGEAAGRPYTGIIYGALDEQEAKVGKPLPSSRISRKFGYMALERRYEATKQWLRDNKERLKPMRATIREAMRTCRTAAAFAQTIRQDGLSVVFHRSREHLGRIYGVTFIDHRSGLVLNGSRLGREFAANRFEELFTQQAHQPQHTASELPPIPEPQALTWTDRIETEEQFVWADEPQQPWTPHHGLGLLGVLLEEAARNKWEPWTPIPRRRKKRRRKV